jgi:hypothetical protein
MSIERLALEHGMTAVCVYLEAVKVVIAKENGYYQYASFSQHSLCLRSRDTSKYGLL